jgi:hypothetical protein
MIIMAENLKLHVGYIPGFKRRTITAPMTGGTVFAMAINVTETILIRP